MLDSAREAMKQGYIAGYMRGSTGGPGLGLNVGYSLYKRITGTAPLEDLNKRLQVPDVTAAPRVPIPEYKRGGLVKRKK